MIHSALLLKNHLFVSIFVVSLSTVFSFSIYFSFYFVSLFSLLFHYLTTYLLFLPLCISLSLFFYSSCSAFTSLPISPPRLPPPLAILSPSPSAVYRQMIQSLKFFFFQKIFLSLFAGILFISFIN